MIYDEMWAMTQMNMYKIFYIDIIKKIIQLTFLKLEQIYYR